MTLFLRLQRKNFCVADCLGVCDVAPDLGLVQDQCGEGTCLGCWQQRKLLEAQACGRVCFGIWL